VPKIICLYSIVKIVSENREICIVGFGGENFVIWLHRNRDGERKLLQIAEHRECGASYRESKKVKQSHYRPG
jgi:hypothetical protein